MKIFKWCIKNDIRVYKEPTRLGKKPPVILVLDYKGQIKKGSEVFAQGSKELELVQLLLMAWVLQGGNAPLEMWMK